MWKYRVFLEPESETDFSQIDLRVFSRGLHRTVINWFNIEDSVLTDKIKESNILRPFNISFLRYDYEQKLYFFEISILNEKINLNKLLENALNKSQETNEVLDFNYSKFKMKKWNLLVSKNYFELLELASKKKDFKFMKIEFLSDTTFMKKSELKNKHTLMHPLPDLELFFYSVVSKWNNFCISKFSIDEVIDYVNENIYVTSANIRTDTFCLGYSKQKPITITGFKGFIILQQAVNDSSWDNIIKALLLYSNWSGVGKKTAFGLGQTKISFF